MLIRARAAAPGGGIGATESSAVTRMVGAGVPRDTDTAQLGSWWFRRRGRPPEKAGPGGGARSGSGANCEAETGRDETSHDREKLGTGSPVPCMPYQ